MTKQKLQIEICSDSGCGLIVADIDDNQYRVSMLPNEVIEAKNILNHNNQQAFIDYIEDINPKFERVISNMGIEKVIDSFVNKTKHIKTN
jgi:hypothetical protein